MPDVVANDDCERSGIEGGWANAEDWTAGEDEVEQEGSTVGCGVAEGAEGDADELDAGPEAETLGESTFALAVGEVCEESMTSEYTAKQMYQ